MAGTAAWDVLPSTPQQIEAVARLCRRMVSRRALFAAGVAVVPIPGVDWATNVGVLLKVLPDINRAFGLSAEQIERLAPDRKLVVFKAITAGGGMLIGRVITQGLAMKMLSLVGVRLTAQQALKFVPIAGQGLSAALTYGALRYVCEQHIRQCMAVCEQLRLPAPTMVDQ
jgi:uncharacterized protein (DUF697 family)